PIPNRAGAGAAAGGVTDSETPTGMGVGMEGGEVADAKAANALGMYACPRTDVAARTCVAAKSPANGATHSMQNLATDRFSVPQAAQTIDISARRSPRR
ncbi:MAG TPA: hypothetical protein VEP93_01715, partial [Variovorax sp.]|nr:hypothetical protein [Variovorax sp.]